MKNIMFHTHAIALRGAAVAVLDYAKYNQEILENTSIIVYPSNYDTTGLPADCITQPDIVDKVKKQFTLLTYDSVDHLNDICLKYNIDFTYFIKWGFNDGLFTKNSKNLIHSVFQCNDPHGDKYAYVSKWLSDYCSNGKHEFVPHIVDLPKTPTEDYRKKLGISKDKIVIGRYGGFYEFDIDFVFYTILEIVIEDPTFVFVFVNTRKFVNHPNIIFLDAIQDTQEKTNFICSCDAMIHARNRGESFGLAISEFLFHNKPVFSFNDGLDKNHIELLKDTNTLYSKYDLKSQLYKLKEPEIYNYDYTKIIKQFSPELVMSKFDEVFLK